MLNRSGHHGQDLRQSARLRLEKSIPSFRDEHNMRAGIISTSARGLGRLLLGCVFVSSLGCAMFEEDTQPKYTRNSPSSRTRHKDTPSDKPSDPNDFLRLPRPQP